MTEARDFPLDAGPLKLAARAWGPPDAPPVLALHGWLDNVASFDLLAPLLPDIHLVAIDLPGHGHSQHRPAGCAYHLVDYVADAIAAADALGWDRFALLGHSLGGAVATFVAGAFPNRIRHLALIEALGPLSEAPWHAPARLARAIEAQRGRSPRTATRKRDLAALVQARQNAGNLPAQAARRLVERGTETTADGVRWCSDGRLREPARQFHSETQVLAYLRAITAPVELVVADNGLIPLDQPGVCRRVRAVTRLNIHRQPGGHHLHLEDPTAVAAALAPALCG
ncbi:MAG: alpha/beta hydrolase [Spiribacter salinus]|uniref:Alpha/beta hydrolase n=1 Tax=Spiribacter salinus TaxID=1335746 RepID=A0A540VSV5_9GAMM|nr:MAG: alpha/beta hydrolase [Spiribacter salinus]